jgi:hypothetical protein
MKYKDINYFQNRKRISDLKKFKNLVNSYFENISFTFHNLSENDIAQEKRTEINLMTARITRFLSDAGVSTEVYYSPPPAIGGPCGRIDILGNIFQAHVFDFNKNTIIDMLEKAIGVYNDDKSLSVIRTINPFFWLNKIFTYIARLPFQLLKDANFNINDKSILVKLLKLFFYLLQVVGILFPIVQWLNII